MRSAAVALALAALGVAVWTWPLPAVAGEPVAANNCETECPRDVSKPIPLRLLQSYKSIRCRAKTSVIFTTKENKVFCAKQEDSWVQNRMEELDKRNSPPSLTVDTSGSKKAEFQKFSRAAVPTTVQSPASLTEKFNTVTHRMATVPVMRTGHPNPSAVNSVSAGSETENPSTKPTPNSDVVVSGSTLQPESTPNVNVVPKITDDPKTFGEVLTSVKESLEETTCDMLAFPTIPGTLVRSTISGRFASEHPTGSPVQSTLHPSSTHSSTDGSKTSSVNPKDMSGATSDPATTLGDTSGSPLSAKASTVPISPGFYQEKFFQTSTAQATGNIPEGTLALPIVLAGYQTYIITLVSLVGALCLASAVISCIYTKSHFYTSALPKEMVQGLLYSPPDPQGDMYAMQVL